ncbi:MAG: UvrD-helicase domain-containing protein [Polyangiaceae bacterium]|nr:UvrD-helicase domain-containing protein [Polyangiaceae bacterium]
MTAGAEVVHAFQRNVVVAASAGTGKTHLLTSLYVLSTLGLTSMGKRDVRDAHDPILPDRIVATTFSRAAAVEIRARVERSLRAIASGAADAPFASEIQARVATLDAPPSAGEITARAKRAIERWNEARIDTLHGLAGDILRRFALPLGLVPGLRVGEEDEIRELSRSALDDVLAAALDGDEAERDAARALVDACGGLARVHDAVLPFLDRLDEEGLSPADLATTDHLALARDLRRRLDAALRDCAASARREIAEAAAQVRTELGTSDLAIPLAARPLLDRLFEMRKPSRANDAELAFFELRGTGPGTNLAKGRALVATFDEAPALEARERAMLSLLARIGETAASERRARAILGFGDLLRLARQTLRDHPEVADEVRGEIDVLLVDEFQDTSRAQRDLVYLLRAERATAGVTPGATDIVGHGLFLVGDRKQSIYAFRGADVSVFTAMCADLAGEAAGRALDIPESLWGTRPSSDFVALRESRRSGPQIISFVNAFSHADFGSLQAGAEEPPITYAEAERLVALKPAGADRVIYVVDDGTPVDDPLLAGEGGLREALIAAASAKTLLDEAKLAPRDLAILARRRATIPLVELGLARLGLPYVVAGRALYDTLEVRDLAALVRLVLDPRDKHALAQVLRGPIGGLSDTALLALCEGRGLSPSVLDKKGPELEKSTFGEEATRLRELRRRFQETRAPVARLAPEEALRTLISAFDLDRIIAGLPRAEARLANLDRLATIARDRGGSLLGFSRWLDRQIADETDEAEAVVFSPEDDAIRVTTIHASKGLDFEAVITLDLGARPKADYAPLGVVRAASEPPRLVVLHRSRLGANLDNPARERAKRLARERAAAERRRITYVAVTRAKRILLVVGAPGRAELESARSTLDAHWEPTLSAMADAWEAPRILESAFAPSGAPPALKPEPAATITRHLAVVQEVALATTPLGVFRDCPRRFQLRFLVGLDEPVASGQLDLFEMASDAPEPEYDDGPTEDEEGDPRVRGRAAHRVLEQYPRERFGAPPETGDIEARLEAEGLEKTAASKLASDLGRFLGSEIAARLGGADVELHREEEVVLRLDGGEGATGLVLRGTADAFAVDHQTDTIDLFDYKLARPRASLGPYAFQLGAYALALARTYPNARVRAGVVFLLGGEVRWLDPSGAPLGADVLDRVEEDLARTANAFARARAAGSYEGVEESTCRALRCGFITACHRKTSPSKR